MQPEQHLASLSGELGFFTRLPPAGFSNQLWIVLVEIIFTCHFETLFPTPSASSKESLWAPSPCLLFLDSRTQLPRYPNIASLTLQDILFSGVEGPSWAQEAANASGPAVHPMAFSRTGVGSILLFSWEQSRWIHPHSKPLAPTESTGGGTDGKKIHNFGTTRLFLTLSKETNKTERSTMKSCTVPNPTDYVWPLWPCIIYHIYIILAFCLLHKSDL